MKKYLLIACLVLAFGFNHFTFSQTDPYSKVINFLDSDGIQSYASCQNYEGNTLIVGETYQEYGMVILIDENGQQIWNQGYTINGSNRHPAFNDAITTHDSCFFLLGNYNHPDDNHYNSFYTKIKNNGDTIWTGSLNIGTLYKCSETNDHGFILIGYQDDQIAIAKIDSLGSLEWSKGLKVGDYYCSGHAIKQKVNGNYLLSGYYQTEAYAPHIAVLAELSIDGEPQWIQTYEDQLDERDLEANDFVFHNDNTYILLFNEWNSIIMKTDDQGNLIWSKEINDTRYWNFTNMRKRKLKKTPNDQLLFFSADNFSSYTKLDLDGNVLLHGYLEITANEIHSTIDDGVLIVGNGPLWLVKKDVINNNIGLIQMDATGYGTACTETSSSSSVDKEFVSAEGSITLLNGASEVSVIMDLSSSIALDYENGCVDAIGGTHEGSFEDSYSISPNPNNGIFSLHADHLIKGRLIIYNSCGQIVYEENMNGLNHQINLEQQPKGLYFCKIESDDSMNSAGKIIIQK